MERMAGIDRRRPLPRFARETFTDWFDARRAPREAPRGDVVLFHDTFITYNAPEIGRAAVELLEVAGYRVQLVDKKCCGRPLISKGMLEEAKAHAEWNVARLHPWVAHGAAIVGLEPSCLLTLRDESVELVRTAEARQVAAASFLLEEFLLREKARGLTLPFRTGARSPDGQPGAQARPDARPDRDRRPGGAALGPVGRRLARGSAAHHRAGRVLHRARPRHRVRGRRGGGLAGRGRRGGGLQRRLRLERDAHRVAARAAGGLRRLRDRRRGPAAARPGPRRAVPAGCGPAPALAAPPARRHRPGDARGAAALGPARPHGARHRGGSRAHRTGPATRGALERAARDVSALRGHPDRVRPPRAGRGRGARRPARAALRALLLRRLLPRAGGVSGPARHRRRVFRRDRHGAAGAVVRALVATGPAGDRSPLTGVSRAV